MGGFPIKQSEEELKCPICNKRTIFVSLLDRDAYFEVNDQIKKADPYHDGIYCNYWEGRFCFRCGYSEIKPENWEQESEC
jgi:hypothetical protein